MEIFPEAAMPRDPIRSTVAAHGRLAGWPGTERNHGRGINLCATVTHMSDRVGVRQLRQNLSRYLDEVKSGSTLVVTERGREVARLVPSGVGDSVLGRLAAERGATLPTATLADVKPRRRAKGKPSREVLDELRGERL